MNLIPHLMKSFSSRGDRSIAEQQSAYMRNLFPFLGLKKPLRDLLQKESFKSYPIDTEQELIDVIKILWEKAEREYQYAALDLLYRYKKLWSDASFKLFEELIRSKSWWDTVDCIASKLVGGYLIDRPDTQKIMDRWIDDESMWIRRTALIYQLTYKQKTDSEKLFSFCRKRMHEKEFFIQKAIGWALRQYGSSHPEMVVNFLIQERGSLAPLSFREAAKYHRDKL